MNQASRFLYPAQAAEQLGVTAKALRLYEKRGLLRPDRTAAGWRTYGPGDMARAAKIVSLRSLGFSLHQIERLLDGDPASLQSTLDDHLTTLESRARALAETISGVRALRADPERALSPSSDVLSRRDGIVDDVHCSFQLPWPWGGETFELHDVRAINYITGPLASGKTRLARKIAEALPEATYLGPERSVDDPMSNPRVDRRLADLVENGATASPSLLALLATTTSKQSGFLIIDMIEQGLDQTTQEVLMAHLRRRVGNGPRLFLLTRSSSILDLAAIGPEETITYCPANHSMPINVRPHPGTPGYEAVATCLASPEVRARTADLIVKRRRLG